MRCYFLRADDDEEGARSPALEISLDLEAPHLDPTDLPPGPQAEDSAASPELAEQKEKVEETDLPKDTPTETDDADRLVSPQPDEKKPDDDPTRRRSQVVASTESVSSEAAARPTSETAKESTLSTAHAQGIGDSAQRVRATWQKELVAHLDRFKRYPVGGSRSNVQVVLQFPLDRLGHVVAADVVKGSGSSAFDEAARAMMERADPVPPPPPPLVADEGLTFTLPVVFRVKT